MKKTKRPDKETLYELYAKERKSQKEIGEMYGVSQSAVYRWLKKYEIKRPPLIDKNTLYTLYVIDKLSASKIGKLYKVDHKIICKYLKDYGIETRPRSFYLKGRTVTKETREKISKANKGRVYGEQALKNIREGSKKNRLKGAGHKIKKQDGYILVYYPTHPKSNNIGYVREHILVVEESIGKPLKDNEVVHHINGIKDDNRIENLQVMTKSEHMSYHSKLRWKKKRKEQTR